MKSWRAVALNACLAAVCMYECMNVWMYVWHLNVCLATAESTPTKYFSGFECTRFITYFLANEPLQNIFSLKIKLSWKIDQMFTAQNNKHQERTKEDERFGISSSFLFGAANVWSCATNKKKLVVREFHRFRSHFFDAWTLVWAVKFKCYLRLYHRTNIP